MTLPATCRRDAVKYHLLAGALIRRAIRYRLQKMCETFRDRGFFCEVREEKNLINSVFVIRVQKEAAEVMREYLTELGRMLEGK